MYELEHVAWEITAKCNLNCIHCCEGGGLDTEELTSAQAENLVLQIADILPQRVTFTGGEPFCRKDWDVLAKGLTDRGIKTDVISNGTLIDEKLAQTIAGAGLNSVCISIDGTKDVHDRLRGEGVYDKAINAIKYLKKNNVTVTAMTTVMKDNINILPQIKKELEAAGAKTWGLQIVCLYGNVKKKPEIMLDEKDINTIIEFCYNSSLEGGIPIIPNSSIGYYTKKETAVRSAFCSEDKQYVFKGSTAGINDVTIKADGNIVGVSMCSFNPQGNVKTQKLADVWVDGFKDFRDFDPDKLQGYCGKCDYADVCGGGDAGVRLSLGETPGLYSENIYCAYRNYKLYAMAI